MTATPARRLPRAARPFAHAQYRILAIALVMSLLGAMRAFFQYFPDLIDEFGWDRAVAEVFETGELSADINRGHGLRLYRWSDLERLLTRDDVRIVGASASNFLSVANESWDDRFLDIELEACCEPGALDGGTHIIVALERV